MSVELGVDVDGVFDRVSISRSGFVGLGMGIAGYPIVDLNDQIGESVVYYLLPPLLDLIYIRGDLLERGKTGVDPVGIDLPNLGEVRSCSVTSHVHPISVFRCLLTVLTQ